MAAVGEEMLSDSNKLKQESKLGIGQTQPTASSSGITAKNHFLSTRIEVEGGWFSVCSATQKKTLGNSSKQMCQITN